MNLELDLAPGTTLRLPRHTPVTVLLHSGRLWLTRRGDADDHFITAGSTLALDGSDEEVVVECDSPGPARLGLQVGAAGPSPLSRLRTWLRQAAQARLPDLDEHALRDIGAPPTLQRAARALDEARRLRVVQAHLIGVG